MPYADGIGIRRSCFDEESADVAMTDDPLGWKDIEIKYRGKPVKGRYNASDNLVTVVAWSGTKTARLGVLPAERLAKMLLRELADQGETK